MVDKIFFSILVLNATGLFAFIAPQFDVTIGAVSLVLLVLNICYLLIKLRYCIVVFRQSSMMGAWLFVLLIWPLLTALYAPSFDIRTIGLQLYYFTLFLGAVIYAIANGESAIRRLIIGSLALTLFGLVLNVMAPHYFEQVASLADAAIARQGRAFGFLLQPNQLAISILFLYTGLFAFGISKSNIWLQRAAMLLLMLAVLMTGSRTGILGVVIVFFFFLLNDLNQKLSSVAFLVRSGVSMLWVVALIVGMNHYLSQLGNIDSGRQDLVDRIEMILSFRLTDDDGIQDDGSVRERRTAQAEYLSMLSERPFLGYGLGSGNYYQDLGRLYLSAHSSALASAFDFGGLYPAVFAILIILFYRRREMRGFKPVLQTSSVAQFVFISVFLFFVSSIFSTRSFYVVMGAFFAAVFFRNMFFDSRSDTRSR